MKRNILKQIISIILVGCIFTLNVFAEGIFTVLVPGCSETTLVFEVILPNADTGGFRNTLIAY